jgi:DNA-binding CsgD family transcriptional regulator
LVIGTDEAVDAIYEAATDPDMWPTALDRIAACTGDVGAVMLWTREDGSFGAIASPGLAEAQRVYQEEGWWRHDVRSQRAVERAYWVTGDVVTDEDAITPEEMETHPFYAEFLSRFDLYRVAAVGVSPDPMLQAALTIQRAVGRPPFEAAEKAIFARLGRHVERSLRLGIAMIEGETKTQALGQALRRLGTAVFTLDYADRVLFSNAAAETLLQTGPLALDNGRLVVRTAGRRLSFGAAIAAQLRSKNADETEFTPLLLHRQDGTRLAAFRMPIRVGQDLAEAVLRRSRSLVLVIDQPADALPDLSLLRDLYGLTSAEARLAAIIGQGASPREAAERLGISEATARTVLKRIYSKTGINRQSQVAVLLSRVGLRT